MYIDAVIIGAGLTGIREALSFYELGEEDVLITDYEDHIGGFLQMLPSLCSEQQKMIQQFKNLPCTIWLQSAVTKIESNKEMHRLTIQRSDGVTEVETKKVIIATGSMEKPRSSHCIPGTRPAGEMTPILAIELLSKGFLPGRNPFVVINNDASKILAEELKKQPDCQGRLRNESEIEVMEVHGSPRVTDVVIKEKASGTIKQYRCDSFVFSSGKIPNCAFLKETNIKINKEGFIYTDQNGLTSLQGIYAKGDCAIQSDFLNHT